MDERFSLVVNPLADATSMPIVACTLAGYHALKSDLGGIPRLALPGLAMVLLSDVNRFNDSYASFSISRDNGLYRLTHL